MNKKFTSEDIIKVAKCCIADNCVSCPLARHGDCITDFMKHILEYMKNEPALSANSTSSTKKENTFQIDDSTKSDICQAYKTADEACSNILTVYEGMSECEQRAFDIGEAYGKIFDTRCKLEKLRGGDNNG